MGRYITFLLLGYFIISVSSCDFGTKGDEHALNRAEELMEQNPDSALFLLEVEIHSKDLNESAYNKYILLLTQAKDKVKKDISTDTLIIGAKKYFDEKGDIPQKALASYYTGRVLAARGDMEKAMLAYMDAEASAKQGKDDALKGLVEYYIGNVNLERLLTDEAIARYKEAVLYFNKAGKYKNEIIAYDKIGISLMTKKEIDSSFHYYNKSLELAKTHNDSVEEAFIMRNIGYSLNKIGEHEKARTYFRRAKNIFNDNEDKAKCDLNTAYSFYNQQNKDSASFYIQKSLDIVKDQDSYSLKMIIYQLLAGMEEKDNDYQEALSSYKEYTSELKKVFKETSNQAILEVQKKYDFEVVQNENKSLLILRQWGGIAILGLIIILLVVGIRYYRKNIESLKTKQALDDANEKIVSLNEIVESFDEKEDSFRKTIFQQFDLFKKFNILNNDLKNNDKLQGVKLKKTIDNILYTGNQLDWDMIFIMMSQMSKGMTDKIREKYARLDENELRICCLEYLGLNNNEIGILIRFTINTVQTKKSAIRKKLGIEGYGNIVDFFNKHLD